MSRTRLRSALAVLALLGGLVFVAPAASAATPPAPQFCTAVHDVAAIRSATAIKALVGQVSLYNRTLGHLGVAARYAPSSKVALSLHAIINDLHSARANQLKASADHNFFSSALYVGKITYYALKAASSSVVVFVAYRACS